MKTKKKPLPLGGGSAGGVHGALTMTPYMTFPSSRPGRSEPRRFTGGNPPNNPYRQPF